MNPIFTLDSAGYFQRDGQRFFPVGANYWPSSAGVEMWTRWPADEIRRDLDLAASLGLNTVRFFLRWQDFEPEAGQYNALMFDRLREMLGWFRERKLLAHPSLFVGWMSGGIFWPQWRNGRNVFADPFMRQRAVEFAQAVAAVLRDYADCILAIDQGNELCCLPDSWQAAPEAVIDWCASVNAAVRKAWPNVLLISGNEQAQVIGDSGWRFGQQPGCDLYSMHAYPVPGWHPIDFDGMTDPLTSSLLPLYVKCARAFGPVMVQEFGTIVTLGQPQQDAYLRGLLPACLKAGANGFLWWCLRDISAQIPPYTTNGFEGILGLVDAAGKVKPGLEYFVEFARTLAANPAAADQHLAANRAEAIGLYWPEYYYHRQPLKDGPNRPDITGRGLLLANYFLTQLGYETRIIRGDEPIPQNLKTLVIAGCSISTPEAQRLDKWVRGGGKLLWHGVDPNNFGPDYIALIGAKPVDYRPARAVELSAFGQSWTLSAFSGGRSVEVLPAEAQVVASALNRPVVLKNNRGAGRVVTALPQIEQTIAPHCGDRVARDRWLTWYREMLQLLA